MAIRSDSANEVNDSAYAAPYLTKVANDFGLNGRWAYRRSYSDYEWLGMSRTTAEQVLKDCDAVLNVAGATCLRIKEGLEVRRLVYFGTDPVYDEIAYAKNEDPSVRPFIESHDDIVTYGENIGAPDCPIPPLPRLRTKCRQPVLIDLWKDGGRRMKRSRQSATGDRPVTM